MIPHRPSPNQPKNVTHTNFQVNPSIIRVHRRMQLILLQNPVFEPLTPVGAAFALETVLLTKKVTVITQISKLLPQSGKSDETTFWVTIACNF